MPIDLCASHKHFLDHLLPVWRSLPVDQRGKVHVDHPLTSLIPDSRPLHEMAQSENPVLVAGMDDLRRVNRQPAILMEHGVGQSYRGDPVAGRNASYAGGEGRHGVTAFLCPNEFAAAPNRETHPKAIIEVIGSPRLASLQGIPAAEEGTKPVVAVTFHWNCTVAAETISGFGHWIEAFRKLAATGDFEVLGHAHPRMFHQVRPIYESYGIEPVEQFTEVLQRADVLCCDNSSVQYEWAALRGPNVVLDLPEYRRHVNHGLRFWDCADIGPRILDPMALPIAIRQALDKRPWPGVDEIIDRVFPSVEDPAGRAAELTVKAAALRPERERAGSRFPRVAMIR